MKTAIPGRSDFSLFDIFLVSVCMESKMENSEFNFCNLSDNSIQCPSNQECQYSSYLNDFICCDLSEDFLLPLIDAEMLLRSEIPNPLYKIEHNLQERYVLPFIKSIQYLDNGCLPGQRPYILRLYNEPAHCEPNAVANRCPKGYNCQFSGLYQTFICCKPFIVCWNTLLNEGFSPGAVYPHTENYHAKIIHSHQLIRQQAHVQSICTK
ncbi:hypothetical protein D917_00022 [Trichinella nativa]|uniref:Uncharacterized protein n=1 Tax=Trichinella nativa TaxID=6335 RepID=A0A1Y3EI44_9BILA|nr:hypothetical protein D917_00022 [Trichinella nativa]